MEMLTINQHKIRRTGITATDLAAIIGVSSWRGPIDVWRSKVVGDHVSAMSGAQSSGLFAEHALARFAEHRLGVECERPEWRIKCVAGSTCRGSKPWQLATPDWLGVTPHDDLCVIECKRRSYSPENAESWGDDGAAQVPADIFAQVQWQLHVVQAHIEVSQAYVAADLWGRPYQLHPIAYDPHWIDLVEPMAERFWRKCEADQQSSSPAPPEPNPNVARQVDEYLRLRWPTPTVDEVPTDETTSDMVRQYIEIRTQINALKVRKNALARSIKEYMGNAYRLIGADAHITLGTRKGRPSTDWQRVLETIAHDYGIGSAELDTIRNANTSTSTYRALSIRESK